MHQYFVFQGCFFSS